MKETLTKDDAPGIYACHSKRVGPDIDMYRLWTGDELLYPNQHTINGGSLDDYTNFRRVYTEEEVAEERKKWEAQCG